MKPYFWIAKQKFKPLGQPQEFKKIDELDIQKFRTIVDKDDELIWFEDTEHGKREIEICKTENIEFTISITHEINGFATPMWSGVVVLNISRRILSSLAVPAKSATPRSQDPALLSATMGRSAVAELPSSLNHTVMVNVLMAHFP